MNPARSLLLAAANSNALHTIATRNPVVRRATRAFMPGESMEDALEAGARLAEDGRTILFTRLGEALTGLPEATEVRDHYRTLFRSIQALGITGEVSVKPTQLGLDQSLPTCLEFLLELAAEAEATGSVLWLDMEDHTYVDRTLELYAAIKQVYPSTGLALQAYLYRTAEDLEDLAPLDPVIRLVKGAYAEPASVAYPKKADTDAAYARLAESMLASVAQAKAQVSGRDTRQSGPRMVFGTHDLGLIQQIDTDAARRGLSRDDWEIHMLYGIGAGQQAELRGRGHSVGTLISYGAAWYRWYMRRLAERPANVWFVVRSAFRK